MALETAPFINSLVITNPINTDPKSEGAAQLRLIKGAVQATFPNITGVVTPTQTELNYVTGITSSVQAQLDAEVLARANADVVEVQARITAVALLAPGASPTFTGTVTLPATGSGTTEAARKDYVDAVAFTTALPAQTGNAGKVVSTNGIAASWSALKTVNSLPLVGAGNIALQAPPIVRKAFITSTTTHTIPAGVLVARPYAVGAGAAGVANTQSGGGGGMAYGDIAVQPGDVLTINIAGGVATVIKGGVTMLTANPASGTTAGTAAKDATVNNGGAFSGGAGSAFLGAGGGSSGSPLGVGVSGSGLASSGGFTSNFGGSGWGGVGCVNGGGGGVGGAGIANYGGNGLTIPSIEPILVGLEGLGGNTGSTGIGGAGQPGAGGGGFGGFGGFGGGGGCVGGGGGFGGGSGGGGNPAAGGFGGGGGNNTVAGGAGGGAAVLIFY